MEHSLTLIVVMLHQQPTSWSEGSVGQLDHLAEGAQTIAPPIQGEPGFMIANDGVETFDLLRRDVGGVREHQLELAPPRSEGSKPVSSQTANPAMEISAAQVALSQGQGLRADVDGESQAFRERLGQAHGQAAAAGAQIGPEKLAGPMGGFALGQFQGQINHQLGLRPGDEHRGPYLEGELAPIASTNQILKGNRFPKVPPPQTFNLLARAAALDGEAGIEPHGPQLGRRDPRRGLQQPIQGVQRSSVFLDELLSPTQKLRPREAFSLERR
jgi:hypothetical protein